MAFCTQCGSKLEEGAAFCTSCGTRQEDVEMAAIDAGDEPEGAAGSVEAFDIDEDEETIAFDEAASAETEPAEADSSTALAPPTEMPIMEAPRPASIPAPDATPAPVGDKKSRTVLIIGIIAAVAVIVACVCAFLLIGQNESLPSSDPAPMADEEEVVDIDITAVDLAETYVTKLPQVDAITYPNMAFDYPVGWSATTEQVGKGTESVAVENRAKTVSIDYEAGFPNAKPARAPYVSYVEKVADSAFVPGYIQGSNYSNMGPFMVAKVGIEASVSTDGKRVLNDYYAVLPESTLDEPNEVNLSLGTPAFTYGGGIEFVAPIPDDGFTPEEEAEVIAILASLRIATQQEVEQFGTTGSLLADYVLPDSATHVYSVAELSGLSDYELFVARNEIFARHGREFQKEELQKHFGSKSWYRPTVSPEAFSDSVLNATEKKNIETIKSIEESHDSPYLA